VGYIRGCGGIRKGEQSEFCMHEGAEREKKKHHLPEKTIKKHNNNASHVSLEFDMVYRLGRVNFLIGKRVLQLLFSLHISFFFPFFFFLFPLDYSRLSRFHDSPICFACYFYLPKSFRGRQSLVVRGTRHRGQCQNVHRQRPGAAMNNSLFMEPYSISLLIVIYHHISLSDEESHGYGLHVNSIPHKYKQAGRGYVAWFLEFGTVCLFKRDVESWFIHLTLSMLNGPRNQYDLTARWKLVEGTLVILTSSRSSGQKRKAWREGVMPVVGASYASAFMNFMSCKNMFVAAHYPAISYTDSLSLRLLYHHAV
jgi:hypothetical protein